MKIVVAGASHASGRARALMAALGVALVPKPLALPSVESPWGVLDSLRDFTTVPDAGRSRSGVAAARRAKKRRKAAQGRRR